VQHTENTAVNIAAAVILHVAIMLHAVGGSAEDNAWAPKTLTAQAEGAATAHETFLPT
jgi:hypothetical protein